MSELQSFEDGAKARLERFQSAIPVSEAKCGMACPKCGEELTEHFDALYTSLPPKHRVSCVCGWIGWVVV